MKLDPRFVDVDFREAVQYGGANPRANNLGSFAPIFEEQIDIIPRADWRSVYDEHKPTMRPMVKKIKDQKQEGSCTSNAGLQGYEIVTNLAHGFDSWFEMSPISLYKHCGRSPNSGSTVECNLRRLRDVGALPTDAMRDMLERHGLDRNHTMPETGFYTPWPNGYEETAKHFRLVEYFDISSIDGFVTALLRGFVVHYGRRGHSILGVGLTFDNNTAYCEYANSWSTQWGNQGFGFDTIDGLRSSINQYGAYAYRTGIRPDVQIPIAKE